MLVTGLEGADILFPDARRTIINDGAPAVFMGDWRPVLAYTGLAPLTIVTFQHPDGGVGLWFLNAAMERCGGSVWELSEPVTADLLQALCPLIESLWDALVLSAHVPMPTEAQQAFLDLPDHARRELMELYLAASDTSLAFKSAASPGSGTSKVAVITCGGRSIPFRNGGLQRLFDPGLLQREHGRLIGDGVLEFPSPIDGQPMTCGKALLLESDLVAYRVHDPRNDVTVFVLAGEIFCRTMAVYVPSAGLVLCVDAAGFEARYADLSIRIHRHIASHGAALFDYLAAGTSAPLHVWRGRNAMHLGHVLWNDLSGIGQIVASKPAQLPTFLVCESESSPEMYGPIDRIFPELEGHMLRRTEPLVGLAETIYQMNALPFRSSGMAVSDALRTRILDTVPALPVVTDAPVVLLGLRTENRTSVDLPGFCRALVAHLARSVGRVVLVVDGHNRHEAGGVIWSHGELNTAGSPIAVELALVETMRDAASGTDVEIVSTIGEPLATSLAWGRAASCFVAFWGAGLAKYRWVCNMPGLVITSAWNLANLNDLVIYSDPRTMDAPTDIAFIPAEAITDRPEADVLIRHGADLAPSLRNFDVDLPMAMQAFDRMAEPYLKPLAQARAQTAPRPARRPRRVAAMA